MSDSSNPSDEWRAPGDHAASTPPDDATTPVPQQGSDFEAPATQPEPQAVAAEPVAAESERRTNRGLLVPVVVAAVVAALVGGGVGAGIAVAVGSHNDGLATVGSTGSGLVINNPSAATAVTAVAAKASPSVVTISVTDSAGDGGTGSGVILNSTGDVLTNNHVVTLEGASSSGTLSVTTNDGRIYAASVVGTDPINDLAVIRLKNASGLTPATFADSTKLNVGDAAIAIGAPLGLSGSVTDGIVSALNRSISVQSSAVPNSSQGDQSNSDGPFQFWDPNSGSGSTASSTVSLAVIQTDAAINPGNSGGALLNSAGQVIGINVAIASASSSSSSTGQSGSIGVGFAIPSDIAKRVANELITNKKATHGLLGAGVGDASSTTSSPVAGALVQTVSAGGAAAKAGLQKGDIVTKFNGVTVTSAGDLTAQVRALEGGASSTLVYVRDGAAKSVKVTLGTYSG